MAELRPTLANWNGRLLPLADVRVSALDRGFLFGDAVYEALRVYAGKAWLLREHLDRLARSLREVRIDADVSRIESRVLETLRASGVREGLIYLQITRGEAPRAHAWKSALVPNELVWVQDYGGDPYAGVRERGVGVVSHPDLRWKRCDVKSTNLLANCLACQAAFEADCPEAVLVDGDGFVTEATHSSLFAVVDGVVVATPNGQAILPGVTRAWLAHGGAEVHERRISLAELRAADEVFMTGTSIEVMPVVAVDGAAVGTGAPGPVTVELLKAYRKAVREFVEND
jgi:D-alanine transaminase